MSSTKAVNISPVANISEPVIIDTLQLYLFIMMLATGPEMEIDMHYSGSFQGLAYGV